ncbi:MAG TPA: hypothetical protein VFG46_27185, partial [Chryseolinea sp.]|nr:hypothetical protein [Chryseolinea sp.]
GRYRNARLWHVPNEAGISEENLFKNATSRFITFTQSNVLTRSFVNRLASRSLVRVGNPC